jgi:hypothetical protein
MEELHRLKQELDDYLNSQKKYFGCKVMKYITFMLEEFAYLFRINLNFKKNTSFTLCVIQGFHSREIDVFSGLLHCVVWWLETSVSEAMLPLSLGMKFIKSP